MPERRFPPPWSVEEYNDACFVVRDHNEQALAYVYFEEAPESSPRIARPASQAADLVTPQTRDDDVLPASSRRCLFARAATSSANGVFGRQADTTSPRRQRR
jgi:hypothetical protein